MQLLPLAVKQTLVPVVTAANFAAVVTSITYADGVVTIPTTAAGHLVVANGDAIVFSGTGALPTGATKGVRYYVISAGVATTTQTFNFSATSGGAAVTLSVANMSGVISVSDYTQAIASPSNTAPFPVWDLTAFGVNGTVETRATNGVVPPSTPNQTAVLVFSLSGTFAGATSVDVQGSADNVTWTSYLGSAVTAVGVSAVTIPATSLKRYLRVLLTGQVYNATGTVDAYLISAD